MSAVLEHAEPQTTTVDVILRNLLGYDEIIGALAVNSEGLVMGSAGMIETDIDVVSLLGASLAGVAERTAQRLGTGRALGLSLYTADGMMTVRNGGDIAVMAFSAVCDGDALLEALQESLDQIREIVGRD